jgi:hypothetical protein
MRASLLLLFTIPLLAGCNDASHQNSAAAANTNFDKRVRCAELSSTGKWDSLPSGPYLDQTYYSPTLDTCVFVMKEAYPDDKDGNIRNDYFLVDALTRKQLWSNDPKNAGDTEEQLDAKLNQELSTLQVTVK